MAIARDAAQVEVDEGRSLFSLQEAVNKWLAARSALIIARNDDAHRAQDPEGIDQALIAGATHVQDLVAREVARRRALPRFERLDGGASTSRRGGAPAVQWFVMYAAGYLGLDARQMMLVEAIAVPYGIRLRDAVTWWEDPGLASDAWTESVDIVLPKAPDS